MEIAKELLTKQTTREYISNNMPAIISARLSTGEVIQCYRSTLYAYLQRWYYKNNDILEYAIIEYVK